MMRIQRRAYAFALVLLSGGAGHLPAATDAEGASCRSPLLIDRLGTEDGLSHNGVFAIAQDRFGFLWIGTQGGLDRWDGKRFVRYPVGSELTDTLGSVLVTALLEDRGGRLWVGTAAGLFRLDAGRAAFERVHLPVAMQRVHRLAEGPEGDVWVATARAVLRMTRDDLRLVFLSEEGVRESVLDLAVDRDGFAWVLHGEPGGSLPSDLQLDERVTLFRLGAEGVVRAIPLDRARAALAPAVAGGVWLDALSPPLGGAEPVAEPVSPFSRIPSALHEDSRGRLWIGTLRGLYVREPGGAPCRVGSQESAPHRLYDEVTTLFEDRAGAIWVGTYGGLLRHDPHRKPFRHLPATEPGRVHAAFVDKGVEGEPISAVAVEDSGALWVGTYGNGLLRIDRESGVRIESHLDDGDDCGNWIWDLEVGDRSEIWMGTSQALCRMDSDAMTVRVSGRFSIRDIEHEPEGRIWLATAGGLAVVDPQTGATRLLAGDEQGVGVLDTVHVDSDGTAWAGSGLEGGGMLVRYRPGEDTMVAPAFVPEGIWDIHRSRRGRLWLATGAGLRWIEERERGLDVRTPGNVPTAVLYSLREDDAGRLWAGTSRGLLRFDPSGEVPPRLFDLDDGSGSLEFNRHAATSAGELLYFGGMRGLTVFDPDEIGDSDLAPQVVLTDVRILGESGERHRNPFDLDAVELAPSDTTLEVEFVALAFTQPQKNRYRYRLEGFDEDWVEAGTLGFARYTGLPPGRYVLRVLGSNADGVWNEVGAALPVVVHPAFWQTAWFRVLVVLAIAGALFSWHRHRVVRLLEMERLRVRIASDLHDDLSSDLSGVALAADSVAHQDGLSTESRKRLGRVRDTALRLVDGVRDIVWAIDPEHDTMEATVRRMRRAAEELLAGSEWTFAVSPAAQRGGIEMARRRDLLLVLKEALHNVARHADAEHVAVRLDAAGRWLTLEVSDDGAGFEPEQARTGSGLASIRRRAAAMGGEVRVSSAPGLGTRLTLRIAKTRDGGAMAKDVASGYR